MSTVGRFVLGLMQNAKRAAVILSGALSGVLQIGIMSVISNLAMKILDAMRREFTRKMTASLLVI